MTNRLFFICPTDYLEPMINWYYEGNNYFYSSLGNGLSMDDATLVQIAELIYNKHITEIIFVLSQSNKLVNTIDIHNKKYFQNQMQATSVGDHLLNLEENWQKEDEQTQKIALFLQQKTIKFKQKLGMLFQEPPTIKSMLFSKENHTFFRSFFELIHATRQHLN